MSSDKIKGLVLFVKTDKGVFEVVLNDAEKKELFKVINQYQIKLVNKDVSEIIKT
jgi:hypothetical protein